VKSQQSLKLRFLNYVFLRFFEMPLQKNVKSRVFFGFSKKRKKRILELCRRPVNVHFASLAAFRLCSIIFVCTICYWENKYDDDDDDDDDDCNEDMSFTTVVHFNFCLRSHRLIRLAQLPHQVNRQHHHKAISH